MANRWIQQRNMHSCGPVALMNLSKWLGRKVTYATDYNYWKEQCCCDRYGSPLRCFVDSLYNIEGIKITPRSVPSLEVIDEALSNGKAVVMKSAFISNGTLQGHYFLITERTSRAFFCINAFTRAEWWTKKSFQKHWMQHHLYYCDECGVAPYIWIVRKID